MTDEIVEAYGACRNCKKLFAVCLDKQEHGNGKRCCPHCNHPLVGTGDGTPVTPKKVLPARLPAQHLVTRIEVGSPALVVDISRDLDLRPIG